MNNLSKCLCALLMIIAASAGVMAQNRGSISGTVTDPNGALVPGATISVKGEAGQQFTGVTNEDGVYRIPAVENGLYTVTISAPNFKMWRPFIQVRLSIPSMTLKLCDFGR